MWAKTKKFMYFSSLLVGLLGVFDFVFLIYWGTVINFGILFPLVVGIPLILIGLIGITGNGHILRIKNTFLRRFFYTSVILFVVSFVLIESLILLSVRTDKNVEADYLVILGAGLKGEQITLTFKNRLDKGIEYLNEYENMKVVVSGGKGPGEDITEALAMEKYLIENGIEANRIIKEDKATSTYENIKYTKEILITTTGRNDYKIMISTNDFHMFRSKFLATRNGFTAYGLTSDTNPYILPNSCIREYFAIIKSLVFDHK